MHAPICFFDGEFGRAVVDILTATDGVVTHRPTAAAIEATVDFLTSWDTGEYPDLRTHTSHGAIDWQVQVDAYLLSWNTGLGYVSLEAVIDPIGGRPIEVSTCRGCNQPVDYCQDHTHAPDMDSDAWTHEYDTARTALDHLLD